MLGCKGWNEGESFEPLINKFLVVTGAMSFRAWIVETYLQILQYLRRAPKDMDKLTLKLKNLTRVGRHSRRTSQKNGLGLLISFPIAFQIVKNRKLFMYQRFLSFIRKQSCEDPSFSLETMIPSYHNQSTPSPEEDLASSRNVAFYIK